MFCFLFFHLAAWTSLCKMIYSQSWTPGHALTFILWKGRKVVCAAIKSHFHDMGAGFSDVTAGRGASQSSAQPMAYNVERWNFQHTFIHWGGSFSERGDIFKPVVNPVKPEPWKNARRFYFFKKLECLFIEFEYMILYFGVILYFGGFWLYTSGRKI